MCEICRQTPCDFHCPNYVPPKAALYCSLCDNGIHNGEEYIKNLDGESAHYDCVTGLSYYAMIEWLGGEIRTMEDFYD